MESAQVSDLLSVHEKDANLLELQKQTLLFVPALVMILLWY
jgi:hypothetical protein